MSDLDIKRADYLKKTEIPAQEAILYERKYVGSGPLHKLRRLIKYKSSYARFIFSKKLHLSSHDTVKTFWGAPMSVLAADIDAFALRSFSMPGGNEYKLIRFLIQNLQPTDIFYDVGANYGFYSLLAREFVSGGEIHLFEPLPDIFRLTQKNLGQEQSIFCNRIALSSECGSSAFFSSVGSNASGTSTLVRDVTARKLGTKYQKIIVPSLTLDYYVAQHKKPTILKLDVEGGECMVLDGGRNFLKTYNPLISLEVWGGDRGRQFSTRAIEILYDLGYVSHRIEEDGSITPDRPYFGSISDFDNYVFKR